MIHFIKYYYNKDRNPRTALNSFKQFFSANPEKYQTLECVIVIEDTAQTIINFKNCERVSTPLFGSIIVLGSGKVAFLDYLDKVGAAKRLATEGFPPDSDKPPPDANKIAYVLEYIVSTIKYQKSNGFGLDYAWGGGFEMAFNRNGKFMEKMDDVFYHTYTNGPKH